MTKYRKQKKLNRNKHTKNKKRDKGGPRNK